MRFPAAIVEDAVDRMTVDYELISPITGELADCVPMCTKRGLEEAIARLARPAPPLVSSTVFGFLHRLRDQLAAHQETLIERTIVETGFIAGDAREMVAGTLEFLADFEVYVSEQPTRTRVIRHSYSAGSNRDMRIAHRPYRAVAALVPQNASLSLAVTVIASALHAGTRVLVRPSLQCCSTGALLAELVRRSGPPESHIEIVNCLANDFLEVCYASPVVDVIHYIGSNQHALSVLNNAFTAGKLCLVDGQGNGILYVDETFPVDEAARIIASGATRFNGETCTSVNGVLIEEVVYPQLAEALVASFRALIVGDPKTPEVQIGPLFSEKQAVNLRALLRDTSGARLLCGGEARGAFFTPAVIEGAAFGDPIVREGFFGPVIWIRPVRRAQVAAWIRNNRFPLSDTILSARRDTIREFAHDSRAARVCVNEDPSIESMFEPWGGYPPSGLNPVSVWSEKYSQAYQLDGRLKEIMSISSGPRDGETCS